MFVINFDSWVDLFVRMILVNLVDEAFCIRICRLFWLLTELASMAMSFDDSAAFSFSLITSSSSCVVIFIKINSLVHRHSMRFILILIPKLCHSSRFLCNTINLILFANRMDSFLPYLFVCIAKCMIKDKWMQFMNASW